MTYYYTSFVIFMILICFCYLCASSFLKKKEALTQMGREWLYWGSGSGSGTSNKSSTQRGSRRKTKGEEVINNIINEEATPPPGGCMCFQIFDLPHFQVALNQQSRSLKQHHPSFFQQHKEPSLLKGNSQQNHS